MRFIIVGAEVAKAAARRIAALRGDRRVRFMRRDCGEVFVTRPEAEYEVTRQPIDNLHSTA